MKKIPTLFKRVFSPDHKTKTILPEVTPGCEAVLEGLCIPTVKWDGACCAIINGEIYKRYDAKVGKNGKQKLPPEGAIPCQPEPDPITGHWPHWVKCDPANPADQYFLEAYKNKWDAWQKRIGVFGQLVLSLPDGTYEAIGPAWQSNPHNLTHNTLVLHGVDMCIELARICAHGGRLTFEFIRDYLSRTDIEGIVFWEPQSKYIKGSDTAYDILHKSTPLCKIKRSDFGFEWPVKSK